MLVSPSLLAADFLHLELDLKMLDSCADWIHLDVMDGTLVPNISFGFSVIDAMAGKVSKPLDAHLMVVHPERWFERLKEDGVSMVSFHYEAARSRTAECIDAIHALDMKAGVAIDPDVPVKKLFPFIGKADFFLIMSVFAGFGGQKFIYDSIDRVATLRAEIVRQGSSGLIEVDGGVSLSNAAALREAGADVLVAGSSVFRAQNPALAVKALREA